MKNKIKYLDHEEKKLIEEIENSEDYIEVTGKELEKSKAMFKQAVINTRIARKLENQKVTINLFKSDISLIKEKAVEEGLPYQTLIKQVVHKFAIGQIKI